MLFLAYLMMVTAGHPTAGPPSVEVFLPTITDASLESLFQRARLIVTGIYSGIGIQIEWRPAHLAPANCTISPMRGRVVVAFQTGPQENMNADALAYASPCLPEGPCVSLLLDRLKTDAMLNPSTTGFLLGHVLAHEIGHVLQGIPRHSDSGLMQQRWSREEVYSMRTQVLRFTAYDAELVLKGLASPTIAGGE